MKELARNIWNSAPAEWLRETLVGYPRQIILYCVCLVWLFIIAVTIPHGVLNPEDINTLWDNVFILEVFIICWLIIIADSLFAFVLSPTPKAMRLKLSTLMNCVCPMVRIVTIPHSPNLHVWLPTRHWQRRSKKLTKAVEQAVMPWMMGVTLLVLPVFALDALHVLDQDKTTAWHWLLHCLNAIVWYAFVVELLTMVAVVERPIEYVKKHWINLVIILLPVFAIIRAFQLLRLSSLSNLSRAYRLRGITARAQKIILLFSVLDRVIPTNPDKKLEKLLLKREDLEDDLMDLEVEIAKAHLEASLQKQVGADQAIDK